MVFYAVAASLSFMASGPAGVDGRQEVYRWLDSLNYGFLSAPFVEVNDPNYTEHKWFGFLTRSGSKDFDILSPDLYTMKHDHGATYRVIDFDRWLKQSEPAISRQRAKKDQIPRSYVIPDDNVSLCVFARIAEKHGRSQISQRLFRAASSSPHGYPEDHGWEDAPTFLDWLKYSLAEQSIRELIRAISDADRPRRQTIELAKVHLKRFPLSKGAPFAKEVVDRLSAQIRVRLGYRAPDPKTPTNAEMIGEWVYELEDCTGLPTMHPGEEYVLLNPPAAHLVVAGFSAVPSLLQALNDRRFTYACRGDFGRASPASLVRVRDAALQILEKISGQKFRQRTFHSTPDLEVAEAKVRARQWWRRAQSSSELDDWERSLRSGSGNTPDLAERIAKAAPQRLLPAVKEALRHDESDFVEAKLIQTVIAIPGTAERDFVYDEMRSAHSRMGRVVAARAVYEYNQEAAVSTMVAELDRSAEPDDGANEDLDQFLVECGRSKAMRALRERIRTFPVARRAEIVFGALSRPKGQSSRIPGLTAAQDEAEKFADMREVEDLLALELGDRERQFGALTGDAYRRFNSPQLSELASYQAASIFGEPYHYQEGLTSRSLEILRVYNLNAWHRRRGLPPIL